MTAGRPRPSVEPTSAAPPADSSVQEPSTASTPSLLLPQHSIALSLSLPAAPGSPAPLPAGGTVLAAATRSAGPAALIRRALIPVTPAFLKGQHDRGGPQAPKVPGPGTYTPSESAPATGRPVGTPPPLHATAAFRARVPRLGPEGASSGAPGPGWYGAPGGCFDGPPRRRTQSLQGGGLPLAILASAPCPTTPSIQPLSAPPPTDEAGGDAPSASGTSSLATRGTDFHSSQQGRRLFESTTSVDSSMPPPEFPGPGDYTAGERPPSAGRSTRGQTCFASRAPRSSLAKDNGMPGPGAYGGLDAGPSISSSASASGSAPSHDRRNTPSKSRLPTQDAGPGPGTYPQPTDFGTRRCRRARSSGDVTQRRFLAVHSPKSLRELQDSGGAPLTAFDSSAPRFLGQPAGEGCPPGTYNHEETKGRSLAADVKARSQPSRRAAVGFDSAAPRFRAPPAAEPAASTPPTPEPPRPRSTASLGGGGGRHASFRSASDRFLCKPSGTPAPGDYEGLHVGEVTARSIMTFKRPRTATTPLSFGRCTDRWLPEAQQSDVPGPGDYQPRPLSRSAGGWPKSTGARLGSLIPKGQGPERGPGTYEVGGSMLKSTFHAPAKAPMKGLPLKQGAGMRPAQ